MLLVLLVSFLVSLFLVVRKAAGDDASLCRSLTIGRFPLA